MYPGVFIVLEGLDNAGKTTVFDRLKSDFPDAVYFREPGGTSISEHIRTELLKADKFADMSPITRFNLLWAAREENLQQILLPALRDGKLVIADRFDASTCAYQVYAQRMPDLMDLLMAEREMCVLERGIDPIYIFLDIKPSDALKRSREDTSREQDHFDRQGLDFRNRVHMGYLEFFKKIRSGNLHTVNAFRSKDEVYEDVLGLIRFHLKMAEVM